MNAPIDLRSDTVTRPTKAMLEAMVQAEVGDDVFGDDPTVLALEARIAALAGKEAAVYVPSGTMGNQLAVMAQTRPGDEVLLEADSHIFCYEQGGVAANAGALARTYASDRGAPPADLIERVLADKHDDDHIAALRLVCIENTHNRHGGRIVPLEALQRLATSARAAGLRVHLDGARLWNASVESGVPIRAWAAVADTVMMCFSKALGAPVGSILAGDAGVIRRARRHRKRLGGGMRQAGLLAGACLHALDHHVDRLADDHRRARRLAEGVADLPGVRVETPDTNIVMIQLADPALEAAPLAAALEARGVRVLAFDPRRLRAIAHLDVDDAGIERAIAGLRAVLAGRPEPAARNRMPA
jgi:threonine aldolase